MADGPLQARIDEVRRRLPIAGVIEQTVKLQGSPGAKNRRGPCPFHAGKSASFSVRGAEGYAHCFGCRWHGDVIRFVQDQFGIDFLAALADCEARAGLEPGGMKAAGRTSAPATDRTPNPVRRERNPVAAPARRERVTVPGLDMGRWIWRHAWTNHEAVRTYFRGRGVPDSVLGDDRLTSFRYLADCPVMAWEIGKDPRSVLIAPAIVALVRRVVWFDDGTGLSESGPSACGGGADRANVRPFDRLGASMPPVGVGPDGSGYAAARFEFVPCGVHVTYLSPDGTGTMLRRVPWAAKDDPDPYFAKRRMLGPVGKGAVLLGSYHPGAHLFVGEGNETVLSGMALAVRHSAEGADRADVRASRSMPPVGVEPDNILGVATLSLGNLQGEPKKWANSTWPLHRIEPDGAHPAFVIPGHRGAVTGLIDSDMAPLRGMVPPGGGAPQGERVVERKGGPIVHRAITGAERAAICAELFVKAWRHAGVREVTAIRAPLGMDFNDVLASGLQEVAA